MSAAATAATLQELQSETSWANLGELERLVTHELPKFYKHAFRLLGNVHDAEDAVQDALLSAYKNLSQFEGRAKLSTWFGVVVANAARMQRRRRNPFVSSAVQLDSTEQGVAPLENFENRQPDPEEVCANLERRDLLLRAMDQLSPVLQRALRLYYLEDMTVAEASEALGVAEGTIKAQLARARVKLAKALGQELRKKVPARLRKTTFNP